MGFLKTDPRVKSQTQRAAEKGLQDMFQRDKPPPKKLPAKFKYKRTAKKVKLKLTLDVESMKIIGASLLATIAFCLMIYSFCSFMATPNVRIMPELDNDIIRIN